MDELQVPVADSAFYLSYFYDVVRAPSIFEGVRRLIGDGRSEAPEVINALAKFNVAPELAVAAAHRWLGIEASPFCFYVRCLVSCLGLAVAALAGTAASLAGGSPVAALAAASMFCSICLSPSLQAGLRLSGGALVALREHWGTSALLVQNFLLVGALKAEKTPKVRLLLFALSTCTFELCWQFAPFALLLQVLSLLGSHTLGCLSRRRLGEVALAAVAGTALALLLLFGNRILLCSPFFAVACCIAALGLAPATSGGAPSTGNGARAASTSPLARGGVVEASLVLGAALVGGLGLHRVLAIAASEQEDAHVLQLLLQKLGLAPPGSSFDAFLYLQSPEFGFLSRQFVDEAVTACAAPAATVAALLLVVAVTRKRFLPWICGRCQEGPGSSAVSRATDVKKGSSAAGGAGGKGGRAAPPAPAPAAQGTETEAEAPWAAWSAQLLLLVAFTLLACLVSRLRVLAAPLLCIIAAQTASPRLWREAFWGSGSAGGRGGWMFYVLANLVGVSLILAPPYLSGAVTRALEVGEEIPDADMHELCQWANRSLPDGSLLMADMTMAAKMRLINPKIRVGNHPQYESLTSRKRNRDYYTTFTCASPARVYEVLSRYSVTHVLLNLNACRARAGKLDQFAERDSDKCGEQNRQSSELQRRTFCWHGFLAQPGQFFELAYRNPIYTVLRLVPQPRQGSSRAPPGSTVGAWQPWLEGLRDPWAARGLARTASDARGGLPSAVRALMLERAEKLAKDDPIVQLARGQQLLEAKDVRAAATRLESAARKAGISPRSEPEDLYRVFLVWKTVLNKQGPKQALPAVRHLAKSLLPFWKETSNAFELCDMAAWLQLWGERKLATELWRAAKASNAFDSCVREDWTKWEGKRPLGQGDLWRAFLGWPLKAKRA